MRLSRSPILACALRLLVACFLVPVQLFAQQTATEHRDLSRSVTFTVVDENGVAVPAARIQLRANSISLRCESDLAGRCQLDLPPASGWNLLVEKEGFYVLSLSNLQIANTLDIVLHHQQEVRESVNVVESVPAIDPEQISSQEQLSGIDIINIPYPNTRDYRYALEYIPGVVLDQSAQPHIEGWMASTSASRRTDNSLSGPVRTRSAR
jgi:hypothetical protein